MVKRTKTLIKNANSDNKKINAIEHLKNESDIEEIPEENDSILDGDIPTINKKKSRMDIIQQNIEILNDNSENTTGVLYIGHLPWGFEDKGIRKYFEQFGKIERILVPRSKKTGRLKGFAFVEFKEKDVAEIAAKTMNNYVLFDKILKCSTVDDTSRYNLIFKKWKRKYKFCDKYQNFVLERNRNKTQEEVKERIKLLLEKEEQKRLKLTELGIKYDFPGFKAIVEQNRPIYQAQTSSKLSKVEETDKKNLKKVKIDEPTDQVKVVKKDTKKQTVNKGKESTNVNEMENVDRNLKDSQKNKTKIPSVTDTATFNKKKNK